jgi:hypothetical protein
MLGFHPGQRVAQQDQQDERNGDGDIAEVQQGGARSETMANTLQ